MMVFLKYFERIEPSKEEKIESVLPEPDRPLAHSMLSSARIEAANSAVVKSLPRTLSMKFPYIFVSLYGWVHDVHE